MRLLRLPRIRKKEMKEEEKVEEIEEEPEEILGEEEEGVGYSDILLSQPSEKKEKIKGKEYLLSQFSLSHEEKKSLERETFGESEELKERKWEKTAPESLEEIEKRIDEGLGEEVMAEPMKEEEEEEEVEIEMIPPEREKIKGRIISREVVYETPGGYVVKVVYRDRDGVKTSYYSVSKVEGIEHFLDELQAYKPIVKPSEEIFPVKKEEKREEKSFLDKFLGKK
ncbi:MAG: hypothetical protein FE048_00750 [Thermoplasmata archaeon]|nr:MAG: hypothetical protein FE048_00750 [Thermoplasmata archaeon]